MSDEKYHFSEREQRGILAMYRAGISPTSIGARYGLKQPEMSNQIRRIAELEKKRLEQDGTTDMEGTQDTIITKEMIKTFYKSKDKAEEVRRMAGLNGFTIQEVVDALVNAGVYITKNTAKRLSELTGKEILTKPDTKLTGTGKNIPDKSMAEADKEVEEALREERELDRQFQIEAREKKKVRQTAAEEGTIKPAGKKDTWTFEREEWSSAKRVHAVTNMVQDVYVNGRPLSKIEIYPRQVGRRIIMTANLIYDKSLPEL